MRLSPTLQRTRCPRALCFHLLASFVALGAAGCASSGTGGGGSPVPTPDTTFDTSWQGCSDTCSPGATQCTPSGQRLQCNYGGNCWSWSTPSDCPYGQICSNGDCTATCTPNCGGKECGPDGCGGVCAKCPSAAPVCVEGQCTLPCTDADDYCAGDTLNYCNPSTGTMSTSTCSWADCVVAGFKDYSKCGSNPGDPAKSCLCVGCTAADNGCSGNKASLCDASTGKVVTSTCPTGTKCSAGTCVVPCKDECSVAVCQNGKEIPCVKGTDGCYKKLAAKGCDDGEVCLSGAGCGPCAKQSDCPTNEVCSVFGSCVSPYEVSLDVTIHSVTFPVYDTTGAAWDIGGGLPDPNICVGNDTDNLACTGAASDALTVPFEKTLSVTLAWGDKLCISAYDSDALSDDYADGSCWPDVAALVKAGGKKGKLFTGLVYVDFSVSPGF